jgi:hypothetical protein
MNEKINKILKNHKATYGGKLIKFTLTINELCDDWFKRNPSTSRQAYRDNSLLIEYFNTHYKKERAYGMMRWKWSSNMPEGPCKRCGAVNYPLSFGGSDICPSCDSGIPPEVSKLKSLLDEAEREIIRLRQEIERLRNRS